MAGSADFVCFPRFALLMVRGGWMRTEGRRHGKPLGQLSLTRGRVVPFTAKQTFPHKMGNHS